jgi:hypothetical protein
MRAASHERRCGRRCVIMAAGNTCSGQFEGKEPSFSRRNRIIHNLEMIGTRVASIPSQCTAGIGGEVARLVRGLGLEFERAVLTCSAVLC